MADADGQLEKGMDTETEHRKVLKALHKADHALAARRSDASERQVRMADLVIDEESVTVVVWTGERVETRHNHVKVPRSSVVRARRVADGLEEIHGIRASGTALPGVMMVGTWWAAGSLTFAACHGRRPAVVVDLSGQPFDRLVITLDDPEDALERLG